MNVQLQLFSSFKQFIENLSTENTTFKFNCFQGFPAPIRTVDIDVWHRMCRNSHTKHYSVCPHTTLEESKQCCITFSSECLSSTRSPSYLNQVWRTPRPFKTPAMTMNSSYVDSGIHIPVIVHTHTHFRCQRYSHLHWGPDTDQHRCSGSPVHS